MQNVLERGSVMDCDMNLYSYYIDAYFVNENMIKLD